MGGDLIQSFPSVTWKVLAGILPLQVSYLSEILLVFLHISVREWKKVILDQLFILDHNSSMTSGRLSTEIKDILIGFSKFEFCRAPRVLGWSEAWISCV